MNRIRLVTASLITALVLPGCLQSETTIHLNKDGSGTLVEQTTLGAQMLGMIEQMSAIGGPDAGKKDPLSEMFSSEKAKAKATTLGEGVTFEKIEPLIAAGSKGARTTYHFADINKLQISPENAMKSVSPMGDAAPPTAKSKPVGFAYTGGTLTMTMPEQPAAAPVADQAPADAADNPQAEAMMKQMLGDMKISIKLVAEPGIASTDATYHDANTITLMDLNMGKLLEKPEALKKLQAAPKDNPAAAMELLKGIDGMKMETKKTVTVKLN